MPNVDPNRALGATKPLLLACACLSLATTLAGCAPKANLPAKEVALPAGWPQAPHPAPNQADAPKVAQTRWWLALGDTTLNTLVEQALAQNPGLQQALARVEAARALSTAQRAARLPEITAGAAGQLQNRLDSAGGGNIVGGFQSRGARTTGLLQGQVNVSWEADLFGRTANLARSTLADARAAQERAAAARLVLVADVVSAYVDLRSAQERSRLIEKSVATQQRLVALVRARAKAGLTSDFELNRALTGLEQAIAELPAAREQEGLARQRLALLAGSATLDAQMLGNAPLPSLSPFSLTSVPADLLRNRPDIRAAEANIARAAADVGVANAELYPRLTLGGDVSASTSLLGSAVPGTPTFATFTPQLTIPLLNWGERRAQVQVRQAQLAESIFAYRDVVLSAYGEVQDQLTRVQEQQERVVSLTRAQQTAARALRQAESLFAQGLTGLTERLDADTQALRTDLDALAARQASANALIGLHRALGAPDPAS
jgi:NodT family efflux transporter outer membrane factor (OMF) lipoprotein